MKYERQTTHGLRRTRFYRIYTAAKGRCENPNTDSYPNYGGRGITFNYADFLEFRDDLYDLYLEHCMEYGIADTTIDRINKDKGYEVGNCRWATRLEQNNNRRPRSAGYGKSFAGTNKVGNRWTARITKNGVQQYLGIFKTPEEAHEAYIAARAT